MSGLTTEAVVQVDGLGRRPGRRTPSGLPPRRPIKGARVAFWMFVSPFFLGITVFGLVAIVWSVYLSFFDARSTLTPTTFSGIDNYVALITDPGFLQSLGTFAVFAIFIVPTSLVFALVLAMLVNNLPFARAFFRSVFFLPTAFSYVVAALIWKLGIFNGQASGVANSVLGALGIDPVSTWLTQSPLYWVAIVSMRLWLQVGFYMLLFLAGLQRIPQVLYEAAAIDGLSRGPRRFWMITWPQLRPTVAAVVLLLTIAAFQAFDEFYNLVPKISAARPPLLYIYNVSFAQLDYGKGAAGALILTAIMIVVALLQNRFLGFNAAEDTPRRRRKAA
ncbi:MULTISPECIES: carbohydrate ABC transporter permease [unclassified Microbacterium]|uniref:carbohydrate ABC transporter permease n=1 Tax=unclassified Microbacterium TaxID=2609290 RepID=UPI00301B3A6F